MIKAIVIIGLLFCVSCQKKKEDTKSVREVFSENRVKGEQDAMKRMADQFQMKKGFSTMPNYYPVRLPAQSARVWIPTLENKVDNAIIPGHVVFLEVYEDRWAIDTEVNSSPYPLSHLRKVPIPKDENEIKWSSHRGKGKGKVFSVPVSDK